MEMVAAVKLRQAQKNVISARPYTNKLINIMGRLVTSCSDFSHPLVEERAEGKVGYIVIAADRGLCGGYNQNVLRFAAEKIEQVGKENASIICVGRKAKEYFVRRNYHISEEYVDFGDLPDYTQAKELARELMETFKKGEFKKLNLVFTEFGSAITHEPKMVQLLPVTSIEGTGETAENTEYIYEPSAGEVLGALLPRSVEMTVYRAILEAKASEHGARMTAMGSATDNASELIEQLVLSYNRARQAAITTEISEIVGGAAALQ